MRKSSGTGNNAGSRNGHRSSDIGSGSRSEHASGIRAMNGCGKLLLPLSLRLMIIDPL
jgi:hypothetical protein